MDKNLKNDKYRKARGGQARLLDIFCSKCDFRVLIYQKDGKGFLHRTYLNRIFWPEKYESLQYDRNVKVKNMPNLKCQSCDEVIGTPMIHRDGRLAVRLRYGYFYKNIHQENS